MAEPFPEHPIYDQLIREREQRQHPEPPAEPPATEWPDQEPTTETHSV